MESLVSGILGGEFQRHFWPGLLLSILIFLTLHISGINLNAISEDFFTKVVILIPISVLIGVVMDFIGHLFVSTYLPRQEALAKSTMLPIVNELISKNFNTHLSGFEIDNSDAKLTAALSFYLTKTINDNQPAQKKFEEQFSYFEFNRSVTLFFIPLIFYLTLLLIFTYGFSNNKLITRYFLFGGYLIFQTFVLILANIVFRNKKQNLLFKIGHFYFKPIFFNYDIITNIQLSMLIEYFLRLNKKEETKA